MAKTKKTQKKKAFASALKKLQAEARQRGVSVTQLMSAVTDQELKSPIPAHVPSLPREILRHLLYTTAGKSSRTPGQHLKSVLNSETKKPIPKELQNWYFQIYGEFAKGDLSEVLSEVLLYSTDRGGESLMLRVRAAIGNGNIRYLEQIVRCVAFLHGIRHETYGARVANRTRSDVGLAYLRIFELSHTPPTAREIYVMLARNACVKANRVSEPKISDIWYLLRSGPNDDSLDLPSRKARYELTGTENIKRLIKSFQWPLAPSLDGPLSLAVVKKILNRLSLKYRDDSETVTGN